MLARHSRAADEAGLRGDDQQRRFRQHGDQRENVVPSQCGRLECLLDKPSA